MKMEISIFLVKSNLFNIYIFQVIFHGGPLTNSAQSMLTLFCLTCFVTSLMILTHNIYMIVHIHVCIFHPAPVD